MMLFLPMLASVPAATNLGTDWWMFAATIVGGILAAAATAFAVIWTSKETAKGYESERARLEKSNALVILKPVLKLTTFYRIWDNLIIKDIWDRVLLLQKDDGFDFFNNENKRQQCYRLLSISNDSTNNIPMLKITLNSVLTVGKNESGKINTSVTYLVNYMRSREEILIPLYGTLQDEKLFAKHETETSYNFTFDCSIEYTTTAKQQICYGFKGKIATTVKVQIERKEDTEEKYNTYEHNVFITKDEPSLPSDVCTLDENAAPSSFINLQDYISGIDRLNYIHKKIGDAQAQGIAERIGTSSFWVSLNDSIHSFKDKIADPFMKILASGSKNEQTNTNEQMETRLLVDNSEEEAGK